MARGLSKKTQLSIIAGMLVITALAAAAQLYISRRDVERFAILTIYYFRSWSAPPVITTVERAAEARNAEATAPPLSAAPTPAAADWPSYNQTLTSERYSRLSEINKQNAGTLKVLCTYDTRQYTSFQSGLIMVDGA